VATRLNETTERLLLGLMNPRNEGNVLYSTPNIIRIANSISICTSLIGLPITLVLPASPNGSPTTVTSIDIATIR
jgi:hypothetical protein